MRKSRKAFIFEVVQYVKNNDMMFLVRASTYQEAIKEVSPIMELLTGSPVVNLVQEVGVGTGNRTCSQLLRGPYYGTAFGLGGGTWSTIDETDKLVLEKGRVTKVVKPTTRVAKKKSSTEKVRLPTSLPRRTDSH